MKKTLDFRLITTNTFIDLNCEKVDSAQTISPEPTIRIIPLGHGDEVYIPLFHDTPSNNWLSSSLSSMLGYKEETITPESILVVKDIEKDSRYGIIANMGEVKDAERYKTYIRVEVDV